MTPALRAVFIGPVTYMERRCGQHRCQKFLFYVSIVVVDVSIIGVNVSIIDVNVRSLISMFQ